MHDETTQGRSVDPRILEAVFDAVGEAIMIVDCSGAVVHMNRSAAAITGVTPAASAGRPLGEILRLKDPDTGADSAPPAPSSSEGSAPSVGGRRLVVSSTGSERLVSVTSKLLPAGEDGLSGIAYCISDETWRRVAEDSMRNSNRLFNGIVENSFDAIYILRGRRYEYVNASFCSITGYSYGELTAPDFDYNVLLTPGTRQFMEDRFNSRLTGQPINPRYRIEVRRKSGEIVDVEVVTVFIGKPGEILVLGIMRDITERIRAETEARDSEELMKGVFASMEDTVFKFDSEGRFVFVNSPRIELLVPPARFMGRSYAEVLPGEVVDQMREAFAAAREGSSSEFEYSLKLWGGSRSFSTRLSPVLHDGVFGGVVSIVRDITELKRAEAEQKALEEQLQRTQLYESLGTLAGGIAHDFNNILMGILGNTDTIMEEIEGPESSKALLAEIDASSRKAADLCRQMLTYAGRGTSSKEPLDVSELIRGMSDLLSVDKPFSASLEISPGGDLPRVEGDPTQIGQIVLNLVQNAFEALPGGSGAVSVRTYAMHPDPGSPKGFVLSDQLLPGEYVVIEVADDGEGMGPTQKDRIFNPFFSTKGPGRGLGLAAVLGIARGHGGAVRIYSEAGNGTTVNVLLPAISDPSRRKGGEEPRAIPVRAGTGRILVVDDEEIVRNVLERMLLKIGYTVLTVSSGMEAVSVFRRSHGDFDAVILDLAMPGMDGHEVMEFLRGMDPEVRVIIASGFSRQQVEEKLGSRTPDGVMQKPFRLDKLLEILGSPPGKPDQA